VFPSFIHPTHFIATSPFPSPKYPPPPCFIGRCLVGFFPIKPLVLPPAFLCHHLSSKRALFLLLSALPTASLPGFVFLHHFTLFPLRCTSSFSAASCFFLLFLLIPPHRVVPPRPPLGCFPLLQGSTPFFGSSFCLSF